MNHPLVKNYKPYNDGGKEINNDSAWWDIAWDDFWEGLPDYSEGEIDGLDDFWEGLDYFKYIVNIVFIVLPMILFELLFVVYNFYFNIAWNRWWANGNIYLIVNTLYLLYQCFISLLIAIEYPFFMRTFRMFRFFGLLGALYYNLLFLGIGIEWYRELYLEDEATYESYEVGDVLFNMFLIYNVILHFPVVFVNGFIITKELTLEFWQFLSSLDEEGGDPEINDLALGFWDLLNIWDDSLWFLDPRTWINYVSSILLEWGIDALWNWIQHDAFSKPAEEG